MPVLQDRRLQTPRPGDIPRPDGAFNYYPARPLCLYRRADGPGDPDATAEERRPGRGLRWRRDGEHFRRPNDKRADENHRLARRSLFYPDFRPVDPLREERQLIEQSGRENEEGLTAGGDDTHADTQHHARSNTKPWPIISRQSFRDGHEPNARINRPVAVSEAGRSRGRRRSASQLVALFQPASFTEADCEAKAVIPFQGPKTAALAALNHDASRITYGTTSGFGPALSFKAWVNSCRLETI
jgi:hypothetical protein